MPMQPPVHDRKEGERGFALLLVFLLAAAVALMLYQQIPRVAFESERDKEQLLIDRGEQYKRAIQVFYMTYKRYPVSIDELEKTNDKRYLRKRYIDPYTGKDEWRLVHINAGGVLTDSLVKPLPNPNDPNSANQLAQNTGQPGSSNNGTGGTSTGLGQNPGAGPSANTNNMGGLPPISLAANSGVPGVAGGVPGQPPGPGDVNPALVRRPSDRPLAPGQFASGPQGALPGAPPDPNNPNPGANPLDPNNLAQLAQGQNGNQQNPNGQNPNGQNPNDPSGQPNQNFAGQNQPGQSQQFGQFGQPQQPDPYNVTANFPPISLQAMQTQQQGNGAQNGQVPGQQGQPAGNQVRIGPNGQFVPVNPTPFGGQPGALPGAQPFPGSQPQFPQSGNQNFGGTTFPGQTQTFPGQQPTDPNLSGQGFGGQNLQNFGGQVGGQNPGGQGAFPGGAPGAGGAPNGAAPNQALNLINQLLTTPRQPPAGVTVGTTGSATGGGLAIAGVASTHEGTALKVYKEKKKYKEWEFIFNPADYAPQAPAATNPAANGSGANPAAGMPGTNPAGGLPGAFQGIGGTNQPGAPQSSPASPNPGGGALTIGP